MDNDLDQADGLSFLDQPRDDGGRFAPKEASLEPAPAPEPAPLAPEPAAAAPAPVEPQPAPVVPPAEPGHVPISAMLDEREKRQDLERQLKALQAAQPRPEAPQAPNLYDDPEGFAAHQTQQTQLATLNIKLDLSEDMARQVHGEDLVDKAKAWAIERMAQSPAFQQEVLSNRSPYGFAVQAYQRDQVVNQLTPDTLAQFKAWQTAMASAQPAPAPAGAAPPLPAATPPRSLATAPSAGGAAPAPGTGSAYDGLFSKG